MLSDIETRKAKPQEKPYKLTDGKGLYLLVTPSGGKLWRVNYRHGGKQKTLALGAYPEITLSAARERLEDARRLLAIGLDPMTERKAVKQEASNTFEAIAKEFMQDHAPRWSDSHRNHVEQALTRDVFPWLGAKSVNDITAPDVLAVLRRIKERGALETAHRTRQFIGQAMRYAVATGKAERDPTHDLKGALPTPPRKHHATITDPKQVGKLLRAIDEYKGGFSTRCAFKLAPLLFVRAGELVKAEWAEFDLEAAEWRIPGERMKAGGRHLVPLSAQAVAILRELFPLSGHGRYVFPGERHRCPHLSPETIRAALRRIGYKPEDMTTHGFRGMASTLLHEMGWPSDMIERQLAHAERNRIKAAYNHAEHLSERRRMMQAWADYLDGLKTGADVIPFRNKA